MKTLMKASLALAAVVAMAAFSPSQASAFVTAQITVADLLNGTTIRVGDKEFYGFHDYVSNGLFGASAVSASSIVVTPINNEEAGELGLYFASASFFVTSGQEQDTHFEFFARVFDDPRLIADNTLHMTASATGTGRVSIAEVVNENGDNGTTLASKLVYALSAGSNESDHKEFLYPAQIIHLSKDIALVGGQEGTAFMSDFSQTFSQTPEPATLSLLALGGGLALVRRRKMRK
jgi:hypothetical protein